MVSIHRVNQLLCHRCPMRFLGTKGSNESSTLGPVDRPNVFKKHLNSGAFGECIAKDTKHPCCHADLNIGRIRVVELSKLARTFKLNEVILSEFWSKSTLSILSRLFLAWGPSNELTMIGQTLGRQSWMPGHCTATALHMAQEAAPGLLVSEFACPTHWTTKCQGWP